MRDYNKWIPEQGKEAGVLPGATSHSPNSVAVSDLSKEVVSVVALVLMLRQKGETGLPWS